MYRRFKFLSVSSASDWQNGEPRFNQTKPPSTGSVTPPMPSASESSSAFALGTASLVVWNHMLTVSDTAPLTAQEQEKIQAVRDTLGTQFCRRCNYCAPCTAGIAIPQVFVLEGYLARYGLADWANGRYAAMSATASDCVGCGACEGRCPYHLPIRDMMQRVTKEFGR